MTLRVLIPEHEIARRTQEMAAEVKYYYRDVDNLLLLWFLTGASVFLSDFSRALGDVGLPHEYTPMGIRSQNDDQTAHKPEVFLPPQMPIRDRHVLLVEDIVDSGRTLAEAIDILTAEGPASLEIITLLSKPSRREVDVSVRWIGFEIADKYVVGVGLDDGKQAFRWLRGICYLE